MDHSFTNQDFSTELFQPTRCIDLPKLKLSNPSDCISNLNYTV